MAEEKLHCKVTLCLMGDKRAFGPGVAELLEGVRRHGSCRAQPGIWACRTPRPGQSCATPKKSGAFLIRRYVGGKDGGRSVLTKQAEIILERYEEMNEALHDVADRQFRQWFNDEELHKLQKMEG